MILQNCTHKNLIIKANGKSKIFHISIRLHLSRVLNRNSVENATPFQSNNSLLSIKKFNWVLVMFQLIVFSEWITFSLAKIPSLGYYSAVGWIRWDYFVYLVEDEPNQIVPLPRHWYMLICHPRPRLVYNWTLPATNLDRARCDPHRVTPEVFPRISEPREILLLCVSYPWRRQWMCSIPKQQRTKKKHLWNKYYYILNEGCSFSHCAWPCQRKLHMSRAILNILII